jgi:uncharacterized protein with HEPN domain
VDFEIVWKIIERDLPPLEQTMRLILAELLESPEDPPTPQAVR